MPCSVQPPAPDYESVRGEIAPKLHALLDKGVSPFLNSEEATSALMIENGENDLQYCAREEAFSIVCEEAFLAECSPAALAVLFQALIQKRKDTGSSDCNEGLFISRSLIKLLVYLGKTKSTAVNIDQAVYNEILALFPTKGYAFLDLLSETDFFDQFVTHELIEEIARNPYTSVEKREALVRKFADRLGLNVSDYNFDLARAESKLTEIFRGSLSAVFQRHDTIVTAVLGSDIDIEGAPSSAEASAEVFGVIRDMRLKLGKRVDSI